MKSVLGKLVYYLGLPIVWIAFRGSTRAYVLLESAEQVLFVKSWFGNQMYKLPGCGVKKTEDPKDGAVRELYEETGIKLNKNQLTMIIDIEQKHIGAKYRHIVYKAKLNDQVWPKSHNQEIMEAVWLSPKQINLNNSNQSTIKALKTAGFGVR